MSLADYAILAAVGSYLLWLLLRKKRKKCTGCCEGCSGCAKAGGADSNRQSI